MGYTHYFPQKRDFTMDEWVAISVAVERIIRVAAYPVAWEYDEPNRPPQINQDAIRFNGIGDGGCETFYVPRLMDRRDRFNFTKTNREGYDVIVVASLIAIEHYAPGALEIRSDGYRSEWMEGLTLAAQALPNVRLGIPEGVEA